MIGRIRGVLVSVSGTSVCVDVGGVGYEIQLTPRDLVSLPGVGEEIVIHTHTHVREDELSLYGFVSDRDREMFRVLITASGVGPRVGMSLLGAMTSTELLRSIVGEDPDALTVAPGVGKRGAQKIILELAPKLSGRDVDLIGDSELSTVRQALEGLGYSAGEINEVVSQVDPDDPLDAQIKAALQALGRR